MPHAATTVIVTTRNRRALLQRAVRSLLAAAPRPREILVVDNASTDGTPAALAALCAEAPGRVRAVREPRVGHAHARNAGLQRARGELVAFMDDDCTCAPDWIGALTRAHELHPECAAIGGLTLGDAGAVAERAGHLFGIFSTLDGARERDGWLARMWRPEQALARPFSVTALSTQNISFKRALIAGLRFDPRAWINEDLDFCWQIYRDHPRGLLYWPSMVCYHRYRAGRAELLHQHLCYGRSYAAAKAQMRRKGNLPARHRGVGYPRRLARYLVFCAAQSLRAGQAPRARLELAALLLGRELAFCAGFCDGALRGAEASLRPSRGSRRALSAAAAADRRRARRSDPLRPCAG